MHSSQQQPLCPAETGLRPVGIANTTMFPGKMPAINQCTFPRTAMVRAASRHLPWARASLHFSGKPSRPGSNIFSSTGEADDQAKSSRGGG
jgi:hypothetical protein